MLGSMLLTLSAAGVTDQGAHAANITSKVSFAGHERRCQAANGGALSVEQDAIPHHIDFLLTQTSCGAMIAGICAGVAGGNTIGEFALSHAERPCMDRSADLSRVPLGVSP
jgi:hypothetical protein